MVPVNISTFVFSPSKIFLRILVPLRKKPKEYFRGKVIYYICLYNMNSKRSFSVFDFIFQNWD